VGEGATEHEQGSGAAAGAAPAAAAGTSASANGERGIPIPGTDYRLTGSEEAAARDRAVRRHEQAHLQALGPYAASGIQYQTRTGPGGEEHAVGGRIKADLNEVPGNPRATLRKAHAVARAAYAPGSPSAADQRVAADAYRLAQQAREELQAQRLDTSG
jgi:hypothetical protein